MCYLGKVLKLFNVGVFAEGEQKVQALQQIKRYELFLGKADIHAGLMTGTPGPGNMQYHERTSIPGVGDI